MNEFAPQPEVAKKLPALLRAGAWPVALLLIFHRVVIVGFNGTVTDDFTTVYLALRRFWNGEMVYAQAYHHVDPLYLYSPGATLLLSPLGLVPNFPLLRDAFILANALAITGALAILTRIVGHRLNGWLWPVSIVIAFATETVTNTLAFTNINGLLLLALAAFLWGFISSQEPGRVPRRKTSPALPGLLAGVCLGLAILIKPQFAPLLALPVVRREGRPLLGAIAIPVVLNAVAFTMPPFADYPSKLVPYLGKTRDFANSSWPGVNAYFHLPPVLYYAVFLLAAVLVAATLLGLLMLLRDNRCDLRLWALTSSGVIFVGIFFLSSLGQQYYSMWLFPLLFTVVLRRSVLHSWPAWLAAALFLLPVDWHSKYLPTVSHWVTVFSATSGWLLLIVVAAATVAGWWRRPPAGAALRQNA